MNRLQELGVSLVTHVGVSFLSRHLYKHPGPAMEPTLMITLKVQSPANIALLERCSTAARYGHPVYLNAMNYVVAFIRVNGNDPEIGLREI